MAKRNKRATIDVTPDVLPTLAAVLPSGMYIVGSETLMGAVRLVLEGAAIEEDGHLQAVVINEGLSRRIELHLAEKPPENA